MNKVMIFILIIVVFIFGINLSDTTISTNEILKDNINNFESEIIQPDNEYKPSELIPKRNKVSSVANKIDETFDNIFEKVKEIIKKL